MYVVIKTTVELAKALEDEVNLSYADLTDGEFSDLDLSYTDLKRINASDATFTNCSFVNAELDLSNLMCATFIDCDLTGADLFACSLEGAQLKNCVVFDEVHTKPLEDVNTYDYP